jgi:hypothetical protein
VYLLNPLKAKSAAHYWDGKDTLCRMYSTGGLSKLKQQIFNEPMGKPICSMCVNVQRKTTMQADSPPKVEMCANRFELISRWGQPVDKEWALRVFNVWLDQRMDLTHPTVYDGVIPQKGDEHGQQ